MAYVPKAPPAPLDKYIREHVNETGIVSTWYYDKSISTSGPYRVDHKYSKEYLDSLKEKKKKVRHVK
jgi:hypothetical protein